MKKIINISVIVPLYNSEDTIQETLDSIFYQTRGVFEIVVCDDASTDNSFNIVKLISERMNKVSLIVNEFEKGAAGARKTAIKYAKGNYIAFLDSDDKWMPKHIELQTDFFIKTGSDFIFSNYISVNKKSGVSRSYILPNKIDLNYLKYTNFIPCLSVVCKKTCLPYDEIPIIKKRNDYALWLFILSKGLIANNSGACNCVYLEDNGGLSANKIDAIKYAQKNLIVNAGVSQFSSYFYIIFHIGIALIKKRSPDLFNLIFGVKK